MSLQEAGWGDLLSGKNLARSLALAGGVALHAINVFVATTVLPSVVKEIGGLNLYAWNTTLFVTVSILGSALTAKLLAATGSRLAYAIAIFFFLGGSMTCALSPSMPVMLFGRALQGLGGGFLFALCYAMIYDVFDERLWPKAMALVSGMWAVATLLGPAVGGIFAQMDAWRMAFGMLVPLALLYLALVWIVLPARNPANSQSTSKVPIPQLFLLTAAVLAVSAGSISPDPLWNIAGLTLGVALTVLLIRKEFTGATRLLPRNALRLDSPLLALYITIGLLVVGMTSETFVPYFLQTLHAQTPLWSGYLAALMAAGWTVSEVWSAGWKEKNIGRAIVNGPVLILAGMIFLAISVPLHAQGNMMVLGLICVGLALVGFGIGLGWPHLLTRILQVAPRNEQDAAATSITTVQLFATAAGSALAGMIANLGGLNVPGGVDGTSSAAWWLFTVLALAPVLAIVSAARVAAMLGAFRN